MTETAPPAPDTLAGLMAGNPQDFAALDAEPDAAAAVESDATGFAAKLAGALTVGGIYYALYEALDLPLVDILRKGWASSLELQKYRDPSQYPPEKKSWVSFGKHKLVSDHAPEVAVMLDGKQVGKLVFDVKLTLTISATRLLVRDGRIWEATGPAFDGKCEIGYRGFALFRKSVGPYRLPQSLHFEDGIAIPANPVPA